MVGVLEGNMSFHLEVGCSGRSKGKGGRPQLSEFLGIEELVDAGLGD